MKRLLYRTPLGGRLRPRAAVLLYHRVAEPASDPHGQAVRPDTFESHLEMLRREYHVAALPDLIGKRYQDRTVAVSFDDGYADNLTAAAPAAARLGVPITVFVTVQPVLDGQPFPWDEREEHGRPLTVEELRRLAALPGVAVGAHTMTHPRLSSIPLEDQRREMTESRSRLAELTGRPVDLLAYPFGKPGDVGPETPRLAAEAGYRAAFLSQAGRIVRSSPRYLLPRLSVHDWPAEALAGKLNAVFDPGQDGKDIKDLNDLKDINDIEVTVL
ncbi:MAG TPA: polysaccharide deacetylase family protein [Thermoanaerobaculia bacterium]